MRSSVHALAFMKLDWIPETGSDYIVLNCNVHVIIIKPMICFPITSLSNWNITWHISENMHPCVYGLIYSVTKCHLDLLPFCAPRLPDKSFSSISVFLDVINDMLEMYILALIAYTWLGITKCDSAYYILHE